MALDPYRARRKLSYRHFLGYSFLLFCLHSLAVSGFLVNEYFHSKDLLMANESLQLDLLKKSIARDFTSIPYDIESLLTQASLQAWFEQPSAERQMQLQQDTRRFLQQRRLYSAVRILDLSGNERLRVTRAPGGVVTAAHPHNHKGHRFFEYVLKMRAGDMYISPVTLREENGEIARPYQPMIRIGTSLGEPGGESRGILVLDYEAERLFSHFSDLLAGSVGHVSLLDRDGYWIKAAQNERDWGVVFGNKQHFARYYATAWSQIGAADHGQFETEHGLFTFISSYPLELIKQHEHSAGEVCRVNARMDNAAYQWKIVSRLEPEQLMRTVWNYLDGVTGLWWLFGSMLSVLLGWFIARWHSERKELNEQLKLNAEVFGTTTNGVVITDADTRIVSVNKSFTHITGYALEDVIGHTPNLLNSGKNPPELYQSMWASIEKTGAWEGEIWNRKRNGEVFPEWLHVSVIKSDGEVSGYVGIFSDISEQKLTEQELYQRAHHDPLTGLANRLLLDDRLKRAIAQGQRSQKRIALLYLDLDRFKPINDQYGHQVGDAVLCEVARRLKNTVRDVDTVARVGGDEFIILLPEEELRADAVSVAERIHDELKRPIEYQDLQLAIGVSIGIALCPEDADEPEALITCADVAMYKTKMATRKNFSHEILK